MMNNIIYYGNLEKSDIFSSSFENKSSIKKIKFGEVSKESNKNNKVNIILL